ncbi:MAG: ABC transporter permease [Clostridiales bacterium]|nr:ABC transporter permease [Clostridiales bacterium]
MIQSFKMALKSISGNKMRSFLTMLGIIIGVMALVILVSLVNGTTSSVTDTINSLGSNMVGVTVSNDYGNPVRKEDLDEWVKRPNIGYAAPIANGSMTGKYNTTSKTVTVYGTTEQYFTIKKSELSIGRFLKASDYENHTNVCVVSSELAEKLVGYTSCLNEEITLNGSKFKIVGVLKENKDASALATIMGNGTLEAYIPYSSHVRLSTDTSNYITTFYLSAADGFTTDSVKTTINQIMLERLNYDEDAFTVNSTDTLEDAMGNITAILSILLGGIAGISLVVGGIGIMNIMLVTVTERTREIGIRKAIGASRGAILRQFLIEAVVLCMIGCAIGIFLSWSFLRLVSVVVSSLDLSFSMNGTVVVVAVTFCFLIGVIFGLYPANKAAKMKPIDALHYSE